MSTPDPEFERVRRPFDAAARRLRAAETGGVLGNYEDELSHLLGQLYRLHELGKGRLVKKLGEKPGKKQWYASLTGSDDLRAARAAIWARTFDAHDTMFVALVGDLYSDSYGEMLASWKPLAQTDKYGRHDDYAKLLANRPVLDTIRRAFDAMAKLL